MYKHVLVSATGFPADAAVFSTALLAGRPFGAHIEFLHAKVDVTEIVVAMSAGGVGGGEAVQSVVDRLEADAAAQEAKAWSAFTGFCPVGNVLYRLGFKPALGAPSRWDLYFLQTDSWYLERRIYVTVGVNIILGSILFLTVSPWWALFPAFVGTAMVWFAATGLCILANILYWIGAEPRLNPGILTATRPLAGARVNGEKHA